MGTKMSVSFANIFMAAVETDIIKLSSYKPVLWKRCIDYIFSLWNITKEVINNFTELANSYHLVLSSYSLRSVSDGDLVEPSSKMRTYGDRLFAVCAPRLWNSLPLSIRRRSSVDTFKNVLKTYLFKMFVSECQ